MLTPGTQLGPYEIAAPLGAGGMGEVYRAKDSRLEREVAIKVLPPQFAQDQARLARFEREAKVVAALSHPNILAIHDYGTEQGQTFTVMELLDGETLRSRVAHGAIPWRRAVEIAVAIADGLAAAHAKGIIHRDLKPENIFLTADGRVKILDFGLARIASPMLPSGETPTATFDAAQTEIGAILGTVGYMSPEQVRGKETDARSDIFSLGCLLYEMVSGQRAFARDSAVETMTAILHDEPPELADSGKNVPQELNRLIQHCLEKSPAARFHSAHDLAYALRAILSDSGISSTHATAAGAARRPLALWIVAACALIGIAAASAFLIVPALRKTAATNQAKKPGQSFQSLAILPLVNVTGDPQAEPLCEGLAEHLSGRLSQVRDLKVRPITSTVHYRGQKADGKTVGRELDVDAVVTGRLRQDGETLVISLELVDARDNSLVWSNRYTGNRQQILDLQDQLARDLSSKLGLRLTGEEEQRLTRRHTEDPEAYLLYREGMYHWHKFTEEGLKTAIEYYERARQKDPNYAPAYLGLGHCYSVLGSSYQSPKENLPKAREFFETALKLDNSLAGGHAAQALHFMFYERNWSAAERELQLALRLDPQLPDAHHFYAFYLAAMRRLPEAIAELKAAKAIDSLAPIRSADLAVMYVFGRQYDHAIAECQKTIDNHPQFPLTYETLGQAYALQGKYEAAIGALEKARAIRKDQASVLGTLGYTYARWGKNDEAEKLLQQLNDLAKGERFVFGLDLATATIHAGLGDIDRALQCLRKAQGAGEPWLIFLNVDPFWDNLRSDPRFDALLRDMGLADKSQPANRTIASVAVLPFAHVGGDADAEFLSDGIPISLTNSLAQLRKLTVRPFSAVSRYKGRETNPPAIGRDLQVQAVLTGTIQKWGEDLAINVELVDIRENKQIWGESYHRKFANLLAVQQEIARDITDKLRLHLTGEEAKQLAKRPTDNLEAFRFYILGRVEWDKRTEAGHTRAIGYFQQALAEDPSYALAHVGMADGYIGLGYFRSRPPEENYSPAKAAALTALAIDDQLAEAHASLAHIKQVYDLDLEGAGREFQRALELNPGYPTTHHWYALYLGALGRHAEAIAVIKRAQELDPRSLIISSAAARVFYYARRYDEAIEQYRRTLAIEPTFSFAQLEIGMAYQQKDMYAQAQTEYEKALALFKGDDWAKALLAHSYARSGKEAQARQLLQELEELSGRTYASPYALALIYTGLDDKDQAFHWLDKAYTDRSRWLIWVNAEPMFDSLHADPRFADVLRRMGLADKTAIQTDQPIDTLAVLPFENQSPDPEAGYLGDDITYSLTDSLARVRELKVRPYSSAARFKAASLDTKAAGRELQVQAVLRGSIQQRGESVLIDVELIHVGEDRRLWGDRYQGPLAQRLTLQQRIIQEVPDRLRVSLTGQDKLALAKLPTQSLKAHELYTLGRLAWNRRSKADLEKAIQHFEQAIQVDPNYALAYAGLADCYVVLPAHSRQSPQLAAAKAKNAALKALALDPMLAEPHCALADIQAFFHWDFTAAERGFQLALERKPNYPTGRHWYGMFLSCMGRHDEAITQLERAQELDPDSLIIRIALAEAFLFARKLDAAEAQARGTLAQAPNFIPASFILGATCLAQKRYPEAIKLFREAWQRDKNFVPIGAFLGYAYGISGDAPRAREVLQEIQQLADEGHVSPLELAAIHLGLGAKHEALTLLEQGSREGHQAMIHIKSDAIFDGLRDEPRFQKILADMKFPE